MKHEQMSLSDFPAFVAAEAKLSQVKERLANAEAERDSLLRNIEGARNKTESLSDQARRMLDGDDAAAVDVGSMREKYGRACRQVALHAEVEHLARQRVEDERAKASAAICEAVRPQFSELVLVELQAGKALLEAQDHRRDFWQGLNDSGVSMATLPGVAPLVKGDLRDPTALFWQRLDDAIELGYVKPDAFIPPAPAPGGDSPMMRPGLRLLAAGPAGIGLVETVGDGSTRPVKGQWHDTPKTAPAWGDAA